MSKMSAFEAKTRFGEDAVKRSVHGLRQLQQRIRKRSRGKAALSPAEIREAITHGRK